MNFQTIPDFSRYGVNIVGEIYDFKLNKLMLLQTNNDGYLRVTLRNESGRKTFSVHRIVAIVFIPNLHNKETVNHMDGIKANNSAHNLEWATRSEQTQHAWDNNLIKDLKSRKEGIRLKQGKPVLCETTGEVFNSIGEACEKYKLKKTNLGRSCLKIKNWKSCGTLPDGTKLTWRFYD